MKKPVKHPTKQEEKKLFTLMEQLDYLFSVNNFDRHIAFKEKENPENAEVAADITIEIAYQRISIRIYPCFWEHTRKEQREFLLHEYCHTIPHPLNVLACDLREGKMVSMEQRRDALEEVTSRIALLLDAQLRSRNKYARIAYEKYLK